MAFLNVLDISSITYAFSAWSGMVHGCYPVSLDLVKPVYLRSLNIVALTKQASKTIGGPKMSGNYYGNLHM